MYVFCDLCVCVIHDCNLLMASLSMNKSSMFDYYCDDCCGLPRQLIVLRTCCFCNSSFNITTFMPMTRKFAKYFSFHPHNFDSSRSCL